MTEVAAEKEKSSKKIEDWEVDDALRTLTKAEEIKTNEPLMKLVAEKAEVQKGALDKITAADVLFGKKKGKDDEN